MSKEQLRSANNAEVDRWEQALTDELLRLFDRQQAVVLARLQGTKARKHTRHWEPPGDRPLEVKMVLDPARWVQDAAGSVAPIIRRLFAAVYGRVSKGLAPDLADAEHALPEGDKRVEDAVQTQLDLVAKGVQNAVATVAEYVQKDEDAGVLMPDLARGVRDLYEQQASTWAGRIATLSAVGSINQAGWFAAWDRGSSAKQWISRRDDKVRDTHEHADGQVRLLDEPFRLGGIPTHPRKSLLMFPGDPNPQVPLDEVINCFPDGTLVEAGGVLAAYRRRYDGPLVRVRVAGGDDLSGTPNHPVLTSRGWVALGELVPGDDLVSCRLGEHMGVADPHVEAAPARIEQVVDALAQAGRAQRVRGAGVQFHGDGSDGEVEVVLADGVLRERVEAAVAQPCGEEVLAGRDASAAGLSLGGEFGVARAASTAGGVGAGGEGSVLLGGAGGGEELVGVGAASRLDAFLAESAHDGGPAYAELARELGDAGAVEVSLREVLAVEVEAFHGWVSNLETSTGWYIANGIVAHNCRCTMVFSPPKKRQAKAADGLEVKDRVRTPAGARHYHQPIGSPIVAHSPSLAPSFSHGAPAPTRSSQAPHGGSGPVIGRIGGAPVDLAGDDPDVRRLLAKHLGPNAPDPATTQVAALRDKRGRVGAYVVWADRDGGPQPKGTILEVSVAPALRGRKIGDELVQLVAAHDHNVAPTTRPAAAVAPPAPLGATVQVTRPARVVKPSGGLPTVRDRTRPGDTPGTSGDFKADSERIDRLQKAYLRDGADTKSLFMRNGRWSRDRERQQQAIIDHFLSQPGVKKDRKILILGGLPGAGKTTTINSPAGQQALGIQLGDYVTVNADEVKSEMIKRGMVPDYPGLSPDESATLFHAESFEIAHSLMRQAAKKGMNFAYDTSLKTSGQVGFATSAGSRTAPPPWETTMLFVDVPLAVAKQRARDRYLNGDRYMPLALIDGMRSMSKRWSSGPSQQFDTVKGQADRWVVVDNSGAAPVVVGQGGRRHARKRP